MRVMQVGIEFIAHGTSLLMKCVGSWVILNIFFLSFIFVCAWTGRLWYLWISITVPNTGSPLGTSYAGEWLVSFGLAEPRSPTQAGAHLCTIDQFPPSSPPLMLDPSSVANRMTQHAGLPLHQKWVGVLREDTPKHLENYESRARTL